MIDIGPNLTQTLDTLTFTVVTIVAIYYVYKILTL
jgi:hypothetical protein